MLVDLSGLKSRLQLTFISEMFLHKDPGGLDRCWMSNLAEKGASSRHERCWRILRRKTSEVCIAGSPPTTASAFERREMKYQQVRTSFSPQIYLPGNKIICQAANTAV